MSVTLETKVSQLGPQGKRLAGKLHKLEIETVRDLIFYYPFRYEDYSRLYQISQLAPGLASTVVGKIELIAINLAPDPDPIARLQILDNPGLVKPNQFD